nr:retrovirus-related Pol polyprotein from transposon TNT 1-94 [Tanacetum cinerariifolium]
MLCEYYEKFVISHETSGSRTSQQNGVVKRCNRMLIEASRTMLIYEKALLFLWAEAITTACYTQNRSIIRLRHGKTTYELLDNKPPDLSFLHVRLLQAYDRRSLLAHQFHKNVMISRVYYVKGLGHNLFSIGQFCDSNLEVAFRQHTCFIHNLKGVDLLTGSRGNNLYTLSLRDMMASSPICILSKASKTKSWLWHGCLSYLNFGTINHVARHGLVRGLPKLKFKKDHLCSACAMGKSKKKPHKPKSEDTNQEKNYLLHMDLCGPIRVSSVNGKKYILIIVNDYSRFTWVNCLRSKDEALDFIINGYVPTKKAFWIYNRRTRLIIETIHVDFNELTTMASKHNSLEPTLHEMTPVTISLGFVLNPPPPTPYVPPSRTDWDILFQPLFDELLNLPPNVDIPAPEVVAPIPEVVAPDRAESTGSPSSTTVDQDAPSSSNS